MISFTAFDVMIHSILYYSLFFLLIYIIERQNFVDICFSENKC